MVPHFTRNLRPWQARGLVAAFLLLLTVFYFRRQLVDGQVLYWGDIGLYFTPMEMFLRQNLLAGRLPLWNPLILCGTPFAGNPQTWPLYPATALLPFFSAPQFFNLTLALHVWLAGLGTYAFARRALGVGVGPALLAAVTFMFGGQLVSKEQFPNMVQASAWLPWVLLCLDRLLRRKRLRDSLALGTVLGLQLLSAHIQMTLLTLYLAAAYGVFGCPAPRLESWSRLRSLALSGCVALGLAMGQLLPTLALFRDAARHKLSFAVVDRFKLPPDQLGNFVLPHLHGSPYAGDWTGRGNAWETCCYVGVLSFGLALWGVFAAFRNSGRRPARFWVGVFVISLWMATGGYGQLYHLAYWVLPGFSAFHDPARCLLPACFALSLLASVGLGQVPARRGRALVIAGVVLVSFADLSHFGRTLFPLAEQAALFPRSPNVAAVQSDPDIQAHQARIIAPTGGVWLRFTSYKNFRESTPGYQSAWADTLTPNLMMPYGLCDAFGYEPVALKATETAASRAAAAFAPRSKPPQRAAAAAESGALGVKYVALCQTSPPEATLPGLTAVRAAPTLPLPGHPPSPGNAVYLLRNTRWLPRAHWEHAPQSAVALSEDGPDQVSLLLRSSAPDRLILEDTQAAGWTATEDGQAVPIEIYAGCLRAVSVPEPGRHRIIFSYAPTPFRLGLYFSLLTWAGLFGAAGCAVSKKLAAAEGFRRRRAE